jgi:CHAT domain-containing protein
MTGAPDNATLALGKARELAARSDSRVHVAVVELAAAVQKLTAGEGSAVEVEQAVRKAWALPEASGAGMSPMVIEVLAKMGFLQAPDENVVLALSEPGNPAGMSCVVSILQGKALMEKKEFAAARAVWKKGLDTCPSRDLRAGFSAMMGVAWVHEGNLEQASRSLLEAANALELAIDDIRIEEMLSNFLGDRGIYFNVLVEMLVRQGRIEEAFDFTERARARAFLQLIGRARLEPRRGADAQLAGEAETLRTQIADWERESFTVPEATARRIRTDLREARLRYEALLTRLKSTSSEYASLSSIKPLTIDDVRASLPPDTTMISYFQTPWSVQAWVIDQKTLHHAVLPMPLSSLQRASCWAGQVGERSVEVLDEPGRCSEFANPEEVYEQLFAPLRSKIANHRLVIVPHGPLHYIPFAALRDAKRKRYLVEDFTITYAPSASSLRFLSEKESGVDGTALVLGNPIGMNGSDLPNAVWEAVRASEALGTRPLLGERAMESRLYELNGKVDLVHIAAHGTYDDKHPLFSRITLAPGDGRDGNLEVHDILGELDLSGVNLVVLAACDSALGKRSGGDDIVGLTRALLYAGTPGVISTLWRINDEATATLMDEFYCRLLAGDLAADALRTAQLTMLKSETNADPTKWAAFSLTGNPMGRWSTSH